MPPTLSVAIATTILSVSALAPVQAQYTYTVTSTGDGSDANVGDHICDNGAAACTLRAAIEEANGTAGLDNIHFNIAGAGPHTIAPTTELPAITDPVVIDGYTQPGASPNTGSPGSGTNAALVIEVTGKDQGTGYLLQLAGSGGSTVRGLVLNRAPFFSVYVTSDNNVIEGNFVGTDVSGTTAMDGGTVWTTGANNTVIGGSTPAALNLISGSNSQGVSMGGTGESLQGNLIGTDRTGVLALGNERGVEICAFGNLIGGSSPGEGNVISGNVGEGVSLSYVDDNVVAGNTIGVGADGVTPLGNGGPGVEVNGTASNNEIGGTSPGAGNTIAHNTGPGVSMDPDPPGPLPTGNSILGNSIHDNTGLAIDLNADGVTANDAGDGDTGANGLQNFPVLTAALGGSAVIEGTLNSAPSTTYTLEFFRSAACDGSGNGEGEELLGSTMTTTDGGGNVAFSVLLTGTAQPGDHVTATATDAAGNTSEFSACVTAVGFGVAASPDTTTVIRGQDGTFPVTVSALGGTFDRDVTLACQGLPAGAACAFSPSVVQPGTSSASSTLTVTTDTTTPTGMNSFTVAGTNSGIEVTSAATVTVTDFSVAVASTPTSVGATAVTFDVTVDPEGGDFGQEVTLTCSGAPTGTSCSLSPTSVTPGADGATSTLTVAIAGVASAPLGRRGVPMWPLWFVGVAVAALGALQQRKRVRVRRYAVATGTLLALAGLGGCGDETITNGDPVTGSVTVTGTSGALTHDATVSITVG